MSDVIDINQYRSLKSLGVRDEQDTQDARVEVLAKAGLRFKYLLERARKSIVGMMQLCLTDDDGNPIIVSWLHKEWEKAIVQNRNVLIRSPRGSTKSTFVAVACPLWWFGKNQNLRITLLGGNDANAAKRLGAIRDHITDNLFYQMVFPHVKEAEGRKNDSLNLTLERTIKGMKEYSVEARGITSDGTGNRADILIADDVVTFRNAILEPGMREKVKQKFLGEWTPTLNPRRGRTWCIYTPWHANDLNAHLEASTKGRWAQRFYHHGKPDNPYHSIIPELFSDQYLEGERYTVGELEYARAYLCDLRDGKVQLVRHEWLRPFVRGEIDRQLLNTGTIIISIDPSGGKKSEVAKKNDPDYVGVSVLLVTLDPPRVAHRPKAPFRIYLLDNYAVRLTTAQAACHVSRVHTRWQAEAIAIEAQGGNDLAGWVMNSYPHLQGIVHAVPAAQSKKARLQACTPLLEHPEQRVLFNPSTIQSKPKPFELFIPEPEPAQEYAERPLRSQLLDFPTKHDDAMDSFTQGMTFIRNTIIPQEMFQSLNNEGRNDDDVDEDSPFNQAPTMDLNVTTIEF